MNASQKKVASSVFRKLKETFGKNNVLKIYSDEADKQRFEIEIGAGDLFPNVTELYGIALKLDKDLNFQSHIDIDTETPAFILSFNNPVNNRPTQEQIDGAVMLLTAISQEYQKIKQVIETISGKRSSPLKVVNGGKANKNMH